MKCVDSSIRVYQPLSFFPELAARLLLLPLPALLDNKNTAFAAFLAKFFAYYAGILLNALAD